MSNLLKSLKGFDKFHQRIDDDLMKVQFMMTKSMTIMTSMANKALQADKESRVISVKDIVSGALDMAVVLGQGHSTLSGKRKGAIRKLLSEDVQQMCDERTDPGSEYLFGDDFLKTGKEVKETKTMLKQMAATMERDTPSFNKKQPAHTNKKSGESYGDNNKKPNHFLGRGKAHNRPPGKQSYTNQSGNKSYNCKNNDSCNRGYKNNQDRSSYRKPHFKNN